MAAFVEETVQSEGETTAIRIDNSPNYEHKEIYELNADPDYLNRIIDGDSLSFSESFSLQLYQPQIGGLNSSVLNGKQLNGSPQLVVVL